MALKIIILIIIIYILIVFFISRLVFKSIGFKKLPLPEKIPKDMESAINSLKKKSKNREEFIKNSYNLIRNRYKSGLISVFTKIYYLFNDDIMLLWKRKGKFMHCSHQNYLLRIILVKSKMFNDSDIEIRHTFWNFNIHQYLKIRLDEKYIEVDPMARIYNGHAWLFKKAFR